MPYTPERRQEIMQEVCARLRKGEPLAQICRTEGFPCRSVVHDWLDADEALRIAYARAREAGFDAIAEDCLEIADETGKDTKFVGDGETPVCNSEWIARSRLRVETRLKLLAKWDPKRYGDKLAVGGSDDMPPIVTEIVRRVVKPDAKP